MKQKKGNENHIEERFSRDGGKKLLTVYALINDLHQASNQHTRAPERTATCPDHKTTESLV